MRQKVNSPSTSQIPQCAIATFSGDCIKRVKAKQCRHYVQTMVITWMRPLSGIPLNVDEFSLASVFFLLFYHLICTSSMTTSKLPILVLPHSLILLPASRVTIPVSNEIGEFLLSLIDESDTLPIVAAIPTPNVSPNPGEEPSLSEWGTAARVVRLVKPAVRNLRQSYLVSLHGLTRVRFIHSSIKKPSVDVLSTHDVEYPPSEKVPSAEAVDRFKQSALRLLDRLAKDSVQQSRREGYHKIANMLDDIANARTPWMADLLIGSINSEYADKLGE